MQYKGLLLVVYLLLISNISCASLDSPPKESRKRSLDFEEEHKEETFASKKRVKDELILEVMSAARTLDKTKLSELVMPLDHLPNSFASIIREFLNGNEFEPFKHIFDA